MQCWETARLTMLVPHTAPYDETHHVFMTLPRYTCTNEDDVPPIVEGTMRHLTQQMHFTLHHLMGDISWHALVAASPLLEELRHTQEGAVARA